MTRYSLMIACSWLSVLLAVGASAAAEKGLTLEKGNHICLIGNTLAERMQHDGWLETLIQSRFPLHQLVFRNLGFSGDELTVRLRSKGFGSPDEHLSFHKADVIFAFFGYNESFAGRRGLEKFKQDLDNFIKHTLARKYNGKTAPHLVLFSPIAHENLNDRNLPDGSKNNKRIKLYTSAMADVAKTNNVLFVDLFKPTSRMYGTSEKPLTINGIHLNEHGNRMLAQTIERALFPNLSERKQDWSNYEKLRAAVLDKNFYWFHRYRTTDGYSIYGGRSYLKFVDGQTNREVMQREMQVLDVMTANRDRRIWAVAEGKDLDLDDSNTPPFIPVKTNKPGAGPEGTHLFLDPEQAIGKMTVAEGMKLNLFASEKMFPELASPVQMAFDSKGRLWVAAWPSYPHWKPKEEMNDKLLCFEDTNGDGKADKMKVFADRLHNPTGFEFWGGGVFVAQAPDLLFLKDTDGDGRADVRRRVLHGIDSADTHHTANSFTLDPGGALYFQEGTFHHTQVETAWGPPRRSANAGVFRYEPRTQKFEVYVSYGFANPHGHVFDRWGQDFVTDGTGNVNYYAAPFSGHIEFPAKHNSYFPFFKQRTRPCAGTEILSSRHFPERNQGNYLIANVIGFQGILRYKVEKDASGFRGVRIEPIIHSSDPNFRPVDIEIGPDGAIYFLDWQNPIIGHMQHNIRDPSRDRIHGRVYRVTYPSRPLLKPVKIAGEPIPKLLDLLKEPENRVRHRAKIELGARNSDEVISALESWVGNLDKSDKDYEHHMLEALWVHQYHNLVDEKLLNRMLRSSEYRARAAATRVLCYWRDRVSYPLDLLQVQANDKHPRVRLETVRACSFFPDARAAEIALESLKYPMDKFLTYALEETMRTLEPYWRPAIASGQPFAVDNPTGAEYVLSKVSTANLIKMPRSSPVYTALLWREGVIPDYRRDAVAGLAKLNGTSVMTELLAAIDRLDKSDSPHVQRVLPDLAHIFTSQPETDFAKSRSEIEKLAATARRSITRRISFVTLITADKSVEKVWRQASGSLSTIRDLVDAVPLIQNLELRASAHPKIEPLLDGLPGPLARQAANNKGTPGRYIRIELPGKKRTLTLAEVEVFSDGRNIAPHGTAKQSATAHGGVASRAIDGKKSGVYLQGGQTHTPENRQDPWWELDLRAEQPIESIVVWNRSEDNGRFAKRLDGFTLKILNSVREPVFTRTGVSAPLESVRIELKGDLARAIHRAAINAITYTGVREKETFVKLAGFVRAGKSRVAAIRALGRIPKRSWPEEQIQPLIDSIVAHVGKLPAKERTTPAVLDELTLGKNLAAALPKKQAARARASLGELAVNVILLRPLPHRMQYDRTQIFVEAGKPVEIVFENIDIMPHNLVITQPGALASVGIAAEKMAAQPDAFLKHFIPDTPQVLFFSRMLEPSQVERLRFTAPKQLGEYPYVCTFPGHWRRMYGTMHVVKSLEDAPLEALAPAADPAIQTRPFVRAWKLADLIDDLDQADRGRTFERGKALFTAVSCDQCHRMNGTGGQVGPDLADVKQKILKKEFKRVDVLREMLEPSKKITENYKTLVIQDADGRVHTGIVVSRDKKVIRLLSNPLEKKEPEVIRSEDIEDEFESKISMMPVGLLNTLTKDEILDLLAYVESAGDREHPAFSK